MLGAQRIHRDRAATWIYPETELGCVRSQKWHLNSGLGIVLTAYWFSEGHKVLMLTGKAP